MRIIPSCEDLARAVSDGSYDEGPWAKRALLRGHMLACWFCRRYIAQLRWIEGAAKTVWGSATADRAFERRLIARLKA